MANVDKPADPPTLPSQRSAAIAAEEKVEQQAKWGELAATNDRVDRLEQLLKEYARDTATAVRGRVITTPPPPQPLESIHAIQQTVSRQPSKTFDVVTKGIAVVLILIIEWFFHH